ncbi:MAG TPA: sensor histidine kinase, partial [Sporosarcina psychrophila]|nr:sensor histidine kinase [Sporosarcina psychrophila]
MKNISHARITKVVVFLIAIVCLTGIAKALIDLEYNRVYLSDVNADNYFESQVFAEESNGLFNNLTKLVGNYKSEAYILSGKALTKDNRREIENELFYDKFYYSDEYDHNLPEAENKRIFKEIYADDIKRKKEERIQMQVKEFYQLVDTLKTYEGIVYYASDGEHVFSNSELNKKEQFESYDAYALFGDYQQKVYPNRVVESHYYGFSTYKFDELNPRTDVMYIAFTDSFLQQKIQEWETDKAKAQKFLNESIAFLIGFIVSFIYLMIVIGRTSFNDKNIHVHVIDKLYNDLNILIVGCLMTMWFVMIIEVVRDIYLLLTVPILIIALLLILSLIKHIKNRTILSHTLIYQILKKAFLAIKHVFDSGSLAVKTVLLVIGYPIVV